MSTDVAVQTKECTRCNQEKPHDEFYRNSSRPDGRQTWCKTCMSEYHETYRNGDEGEDAAEEVTPIVDPLEDAPTWTEMIETIGAFVRASKERTRREVDDGRSERERKLEDVLCVVRDKVFESNLVRSVYEDEYELLLDTLDE